MYTADWNSIKLSAYTYTWMESAASGSSRFLPGLPTHDLVDQHPHNDNLHQIGEHPAQAVRSGIFGQYTNEETGGTRA